MLNSVQPSARGSLRAVHTCTPPCACPAGRHDSRHGHRPRLPTCAWEPPASTAETICLAAAFWLEQMRDSRAVTSEALGTVLPLASAQGARRSLSGALLNAPSALEWALAPSTVAYTRSEGDAGCGKGNQRASCSAQHAVPAPHRSGSCRGSSPPGRCQTCGTW